MVLCSNEVKKIFLTRSLINGRCKPNLISLQIFISLILKYFLKKSHLTGYLCIHIIVDLPLRVQELQICEHFCTDNGLLKRKTVRFLPA